MSNRAHAARGDRTGPATSIATDITRDGRSPVDVIDEFSERIEHLNPHLNAIVAARPEGARRDAARLEESVAAGRDPGRLESVPFTVKDVLSTSDLPTTCGSRVLSGYQTNSDATVVRRLRRAGGVLVGKTNCPEFSFGIDTDNDLYGATRNPLGDLTPGGSSGGEAAAVAAGMSAIGVGTDYGGSVRWPAQCTGILGLRPTIGRVPTTGFAPGIDDREPLTVNERSAQGRLNAVGLLGTHVDDLYRALQVVSGPDGIDPFAVPARLGDPSLVRLDGVEVRYGSSLDGQSVAREVTDAVAWAVESLSRDGVTAIQGLPTQLDAAVELYSQLRQTDPLHEIRRVSSDRREQLTGLVRRIVGSVAQVDESEIVKLWAQRAHLAGGLATWLRGERLLILPVASQLPFSRTDQDAAEARGRFDILQMSRATTLYGLPSLSVPCPRATSGRPVSVQIVGPAFREDLVLAAGHSLDDRRRTEFDESA